VSLKIFILSPHYDDAAYGLSLHIAGFVNNRIPLTIINCFTVTQWTAHAVEEKGVNEISLLRKREDEAFYCLFGPDIQCVDLHLLDAPLRNNYIFKYKPFDHGEWEVVETLKNKLKKHVNGLLLCPLGIGNHIDHAICREAVSELYRSLDVVFYEDLPYAARISPEEVTLYVNDLESKLGVKLSNHTYNLQDCNPDKELAIRVYESQMKDEFSAEIIAYMNKLSGERLWGETELLEKIKRGLGCQIDI
jgi:LmbE family N-acetylglucosaminyl deacetylase